MNEIRERYTTSAEFRAQCQLRFVGAGSNGKAYQFELDGVRYIIRHNYDGSYTWL